MAGRSRRMLGHALVASAACLVVVRLSRWACSFSPSIAFVGHPPRTDFHSQVVRHAGMPGMPGMGDMSALEDMMKDPEKMKALQSEYEKMMKDPEKQKQLEEYGKMTQSAVEKLKDDPELQDFFEDVRKNGISAMKKYENDERILEKFSKATGGPGAMPGMGGMFGGMPGAGAGGMPTPAASQPAYKPGDMVIIKGLSKAPELNDKKAMVVPPTQEEQKTLQGTDRLIVRLLDTGDQFAVKPANLRTTAQAADEIMGKSLEDVSLYDPALQTEAAKLRESGKLDDLQNDPELKPIFEDIKKNGMGALEKYWSDEKLMAKISKAMAR
eukprot:TRINITY_DN112358_c0_g1_i1.p1 TRINITY_DN112358_c0_g1~~TRINITY_DN112358_c0_g1_i1.p1  ORF type:complete len:326 (-),score=95.67 TRINITY_DN112358_c0_g1_i1:100-1077(-)